MHRRAQVAIEYLVIMGFAFLMTMPLIIVFYQQQTSTNEEISNSQANRIAEEVVASADAVYYLGYPSLKTVRIYFPQGINSVTLQDNAVSVLMDSSHGDYEVVRWSAANLTGSLRTYPGLHIVEFQANYDNVTITD